MATKASFCRRYCAMSFWARAGSQPRRASFLFHVPVCALAALVTTGREGTSVLGETVWANTEPTLVAQHPAPRIRERFGAALARNVHCGISCSKSGGSSFSLIQVHDACAAMSEPQVALLASDDWAEPRGLSLVVGKIVYGGVAGACVVELSPADEANLSIAGLHPNPASAFTLGLHRRSRCQHRYIP